MICTISKHAAEAKGFGDALMLDYRGYIAETTGANIFLVIDGVIPHPHPGLLSRRHHRRNRDRSREAARLRGGRTAHHARRDRPGAGDIRHRHAAEVTPVRAIDDRHYQVGTITGQLVDDFRALTRAPAG
jgi:branched-chain amino acid aminotransferase